MPHHRLASVLAGFGLAAPLLAQCADPPLPAAGFATTAALDQLITYSDADRTRVDGRWPTAAQPKGDAAVALAGDHLDPSCHRSQRRFTHIRS
ncbi:MAG: hypothetical protein ACK501_06685 [Planctomycetota bacterium]|jgi:hypothetical protein